jgi:hypothetical protein
MEMNRASLAGIVAALAVTGCDGSGSLAGDTATADTVADTGADVAPDVPTDTPADTGPDASSDPVPSSPPGLLYAGPRDGSAVVPWDPAHPRPLVVLTRYSAETTWHVSMAEVSETGLVGGMVTDELRVFGWGDLSADAPSLLYEGSLAGASIPGWIADDPMPIVVLTRYAGSGTWFVSMVEVDGGGGVAGPVTDEVKVWGWPPGALGRPSVVCDGPPGAGTVVPGWDHESPAPLIVLARPTSAPTWWLSMADVSEAGAVGGVVADRVRAYGW